MAHGMDSRTSMNCHFEAIVGMALHCQKASSGFLSRSKEPVAGLFKRPGNTPALRTASTPSEVLDQPAAIGCFFVRVFDRKHMFQFYISKECWRFLASE